MNPNPAVTGSTPDPAVYAKTDVTDLVETIQSVAQENKKDMAELIKLHHIMYDGIIQRQNDELENYRRGALRQSVIHVLRSVAAIYNENNQDMATVNNPVALLQYIMSQLKELLQDNDVQIVQSIGGTAFDRKMMRTHERHLIPTTVPEHDRMVVESIQPGFIFYGEPILQELVSIYKFMPASEHIEDYNPESEEISHA